MNIQKKTEGGIIGPVRLIFKQNMSLPEGEQRTGGPEKKIKSAKKLFSGNPFETGEKALDKAKNVGPSRLISIFKERPEVGERKRAFRDFRNKIENKILRSSGFNPDAFDKVKEIGLRLEREKKTFASAGSFQAACESIAGEVINGFGLKAIDFNQIAGDDENLRTALSRVSREQQAYQGKELPKDKLPVLTGEAEKIQKMHGQLMASIRNTERRYGADPTVRVAVQGALANLAIAKTTDEIKEIQLTFERDTKRIKETYPQIVSPNEIRRMAGANTRQFARERRINLSGFGIDPNDNAALYKAIVAEQRKLGFTGTDVDGELGQTTWKVIERKDPDLYFALFMGPEKQPHETLVVDEKETSPLKPSLLTALEVDHVWKTTEALTSTDGKVVIEPNELVYIESVAVAGKTVTLTRFNGERETFVVSTGRLAVASPDGQRRFMESYVAELAKRAPDSKVVILYRNGNQQELVAKKAAAIAGTRDPDIVQYKFV